jgi:hypothetical protein
MFHQYGAQIKYGLQMRLALIGEQTVRVLMEHVRLDNNRNRWIPMANQWWFPFEALTNLEMLLPYMNTSFANLHSHWVAKQSSASCSTGILIELCCRRHTQPHLSLYALNIANNGPAVAGAGATTEESAIPSQAPRKRGRKPKNQKATAAAPEAPVIIQGPHDDRACADDTQPANHECAGDEHQHHGLECVDK